MNKRVPGVFVPDHIIDEIDRAKDKSKKSIEIAASFIEEIKTIAQGVHIMTIGIHEKVPLLLDTAKL